MNRSMISAVSSMQGLQQRLDIIANNIANMDTVGFKRRDASFEDLLNSVQEQPKEFLQTGRHTPLGLTLGSGSRVSRVELDLSQGELKTTENPLDFAIEGRGLFEVAVNTTDAAGNPVTRPMWTRNGAFHYSILPNDPDNLALTTQDGYQLVGADGNPIRIPKNSRIVVDTSGRISAYPQADPQAQPEQVGRIKVVRVLRPQLLDNVGNNLYALPELDAQGNPLLPDYVVQQVDANQLQNTADEISVRQGFVESSNVDLTKEMTDMVQIERAYQLTARAISSSEQMMGMAYNLRG